MHMTNNQLARRQPLNVQEHMARRAGSRARSARVTAKRQPNRRFTASRAAKLRRRTRSAGRRRKIYSSAWLIPETCGSKYPTPERKRAASTKLGRRGSTVLPKIVISVGQSCRFAQTSGHGGGAPPPYHKPAATQHRPTINVGEN
jgi:hypothetical protein